jgi:hypothetical protein
MASLHAKHGWLVLNKTTHPFPWKMLWEALDELRLHA